MSIRARLLLMAVLAALLPALLGLARFLQAREQLIAEDTARLQQMAVQQALTIEQRVQGTAQLLYGLARAEELLGVQDRKTCSAFLSTVREAYPQYTGIITISPAGRLHCDSLRSGRELDLSDRAYFKAAQAAPDGVVLEATFGRITGIAVLQVAHPVRAANGELRFVLLASLNLPRLVTQGPPPVTDATLWLMDRAGTVLARSDGLSEGAVPGLSMAGTPAFLFVSRREAAVTADSTGSAELPGPDGRTQVWVKAEATGLNPAPLLVAASVPKATLLQPANRRFQQDLLILVLAALALFLAVWLLSEYGIRRPVARLQRMAGQLAGGDLTARLDPPWPGGELGSLMTALNQTAGALEQQHAKVAELNSRLQQSQRMEAIGQLTGGVAHDFNNLLTVVMGNAELLAEQPHADAQQRRLAESIVAAAQRGADLTQRLLAFARKQALDPKPVDVNLLLAGMDSMLRRTLGEQVQIESIRAAGLWPALVDSGQLENALLNLCLNARDAMPSGGRLTLETANVRLDDDYAQRYSEVAPGQYVLLAVSDAGQGISAANLKRVFEPFFTTKPKGKGTGLGLAMVYGFVKQSSGHVAVYSEPGQGTTVKLYLPRALDVAVVAEQARPEVGVAGGREKILLVEDDDEVRRYAVAALRSFGYQVLEAADGRSAWALVQQHNDLDLLFTDVVMPGDMNGRALADQARVLRPGLRVLYTSGYTENAIVHHGRLDPGAQLLGKPYRRSDLDRAVRAALSTPSP